VQRSVTLCSALMSRPVPCRAKTSLTPTPNKAKEKKNERKNIFDVQRWIEDEEKRDGKIRKSFHEAFACLFHGRNEIRIHKFAFTASRYLFLTVFLFSFSMIFFSSSMYTYRATETSPYTIS
jgi:hypothetical protein